jgi:hypothetical protein
MDHMFTLICFFELGVAHFSYIPCLLGFVYLLLKNSSSLIPELMAAYLNSDDSKC